MTQHILKLSFGSSTHQHLCQLTESENIANRLESERGWRQTSKQRPPRLRHRADTFTNQRPSIHLESLTGYGEYSKCIPEIILRDLVFSVASGQWGLPCRLRHSSRGRCCRVKKTKSLSQIYSLRIEIIISVFKKPSLCLKSLTGVWTVGTFLPAEESVLVEYEEQLP